MASETTTEAAKKPRAVICDDGPMTRMLLRGILERSGYEVLAGVGTAIEALQLVVTYQPEVLLLDLVLPTVPGESILPALHDGAPNTTVIIVSSFDPSVAVKNGAMFIIPKGANTQLETTLVALAHRPVAV